MCDPFTQPFPRGTPSPKSLRCSSERITSGLVFMVPAVSYRLGVGMEDATIKIISVADDKYHSLSNRDKAGMRITWSLIAGNKDFVICPRWNNRDPIYILTRNIFFKTLNKRNLVLKTENPVIKESNHV